MKQPSHIHTFFASISSVGADIRLKLHLYFPPPPLRCQPSFPRLLLFAHVLILALSTTAPGLAAPSSVFQTPFLSFEISPDTGRYEIRDRQANVVWKSNPYQPRFGEIALITNAKPRRLALATCEVTPAANGLTATFHPLAQNPNAAVRVSVRPLLGGKTLEFSCEADPALNVDSLRLLDEALWAADSDKGYAIVPVREGLLIPADSGKAFNQRFDTFAYEGCHMEMLGVVKNGAAALVTWHDPYVAADVRSAVTNASWLAGKQALSISLDLRKSARSFRLQFLGKGDYLDIAKAYRQVAQQKGWLVTWDRKLKDHPERAKYFGASDFKLWSTLSRRMSEDSQKEESVKVNWTFDEAAQIAAHLKNDLKLDKVLFMMGGWIHRGYDNQHPDILPTAPECGGDLAFSNCCRRIRSLGYILCLHDNYQDIYRDSPSWNEDLIMKNAAGKLTAGGKWAGGRAYLTCSQKAVELARRPQNLPAVRRLSGAGACFIDTTYAASLQECFDPNHPLTRWDDMKWKQAISDYARDVFGSFGSECGREWAIPHADFFEGYTGVRGTYYHNLDPAKLGAAVVPLFEMVYRDCIAAYGKYGYDITRSAEYVLHHISIGRPLNYHGVPPGLYWKQPAPDPAQTKSLPADGDPGVFTRADNGWAAGLHPLDRFLKNTHEVLSPLNELTAQMPMTRHQFLTPDRKVRRSVFARGPKTVEVVVNSGALPYCHKSTLGGEVVLPPYGFIVEAPTFAAVHAQSWNGLRYDAPVMFTLRSLDGRPLNRARRVRVFHAFGDARLKLPKNVVAVPAEKSTTP